MSTSTGIALFVAANFVAFLNNFYVARRGNVAAAEVVTGIVQAVPISKHFRSILLHQVWMGYTGGGVVLTLLLAFVNLRIAALVTDENLRALAHGTAFAAFAAALFWLVSASTQYVYYRSLLRHPEQEEKRNA